MENLAGRASFVLRNGTVKDGGNMTTTAESLGYDGADDEEFQKALKDAKVAGIVPGNVYNDDLAGAFKVSVRDSKGEYADVLVQASPEQREMFAKTHALGKAALTGTASTYMSQEINPFTGEPNNIEYVAVPTLKGKGNKGKFEPEVYRYVLDDQGNRLYSLPYNGDKNNPIYSVPLSVVSESEKDAFVNSPLFKTKQTNIE